MDQLRRREVFGAAGYPVAGAVLTLDEPVATHTHDFLELAVLLAGSVTYVSPKGEQHLEVGAVAAVRPGEWHGFDAPREAVVGNLYLGEELLHAELRWLLEIAGLGRFLLRGGLAAGGLDAGARATVRTELAALGELHAAPGDASAMQAVGTAYAVLAELARIGLDAGENDALSAPIRQMLLLISRQPAHPWSMAELAAEVGHSVSHLHREFRAQLGLTPMAWLARTRAELAASLLLQGDRPIASIGRQVGWPEPNYFSRCFRRAYGMSPSTYRQRNR